MFKMAIAAKHTAMWIKVASIFKLVKSSLHLECPLTPSELRQSLLTAPPTPKKKNADRELGHRQGLFEN